jgi:hypothetical protein
MDEVGRLDMSQRRTSELVHELENMAIEDRVRDKALSAVPVQSTGSVSSMACSHPCFA